MMEDIKVGRYCRPPTDMWHWVRIPFRRTNFWKYVWYYGNVITTKHYQSQYSHCAHSQYIMDGYGWNSLPTLGCGINTTKNGAKIQQQDYNFHIGTNHGRIQSSNCFRSEILVYSNFPIIQYSNFLIVQYSNTLKRVRRLNHFYI